MLVNSTPPCIPNNTPCACPDPEFVVKMYQLFPVFLPLSMTQLHVHTAPILIHISTVKAEDDKAELDAISTNFDVPVKVNPFPAVEAAWNTLAPVTEMLPGEPDAL